MPHVTFIHGLSNKPELTALRRIWLNALSKHGASGNAGLSLGVNGVTTSMVYWADVLYPEPDANVAAYESTEESSAEEVDGSGNASIPIGHTQAERQYIAAARARMTGESEAAIDAILTQELHDTAAALESYDGQVLREDLEEIKLERIPLPWFIKKRIMEAYIRDAYLYQFDKTFSPRDGVEFRVREEIRRRFVQSLKEVGDVDKHIVVSHSMGTMIAYDCLKRVPDCPAIDGLITIGSPLGVDEVQDGFKPEWTRKDGFPSERLDGEWVNVYDRLDLICAADPKLAGDYRAGGADRITDVRVSNDGAWRHSIVKYLGQRKLRSELVRLLGLSP